MEHRETVAELQTTRAAAEQLGVANGELEACMAELMRQRDELADVLEQTRAAVEEMEREGRWGVGDGGGPGSAHNCEDEDVDVDPHAHLMMMDSKDALAEGPNHHQHQYPSAALAGSWSAPASLSLADELAAGPPVPSATTPAAPAIIVSTAEVGVQMNPDSPSLAPAAAVGVSDAVVEPVAVIEPWAAPVGPEVGAPAPVPRLKSKMVALLPPTPTPSAGQLLPVIDTTHTISRNPLLPNLATTPRLLSARIPTSTVNTGNTLAFYLPPPNTIASRPISRSESAPSVSGYLLASAGARPLSTVSSTHHSVVPALSPAMLAGKLSEMSVRSDVARDRARTASLQSTAANAALHREPSTRSTLHSQFHRGIQNPVSTDDDDDEEVELGGGGVTMATLKPAMAASSTLNLLGSSSPSALPTAVPALDTDNVQILPSLESAFGLSLQPTAPAVVTTPAVATPAVFAASALVTPAVAPTQAAAVAVVEPPYAPLVSGDSKSLADDERESPRPAISTPELVRARTIGPSQSTSGMSPEKRHGMVLADDAALEAASAAMDELVVTPRAANLGGGVAVTPALRLVQKKDTPKPWPMWHPHPTADPDAAVADGDDDAFIEASDQEEQEDEEEETSGYTNTGGVKHNSHHTKARAGATVHRAVLPRRAGRAPPVPAAPVVVADPRNVHVPALLCGQWMLKFDRNGRHPRVRFFWVHDTAVFGDVKVFWAKRNPFAPEAMPPTVTEAAAAMGGWWGDNPAVWHHQVGGDAENGGPLGRRANGAGPHHMNALGVGLSFASKVANVTGVVQGMRGVHIPGMPTRSQHASPVKLSGSAAAPPPQFDASSSDSGATRQNQHHQTVHALDALRTTNTYLVLHTTSRRLDLQAPSQAAHDAWLYGLQYLLESPHTRTTSPIPSPVTAAAPASLPAPVSQLQRPTATAVPPPLPLPPAPKERKRSAVSAVVRAMMYKSKVNRGVASTAPPPAAAAAAGSFASRIQGFGSGSSSIPAPTTPAPRTAPTAAATAAGIAPRAAPATRTATATSAGSTASSMLLRDAPPPSRVPILSVPPSSKHHQHHLLADSKSLSANTSRGSLSRVPLTVHNPHDPAVAALSMGGGTVDGAVVDDAASSSTGSGSVRGGGGSGTPTTRVVSEGIKRRTSMMFASVVDKVRFN
ncbi:hypothetical protein BC828DRAFT_373958 [Blastocladiella britannica]|nr:hypothetical protein BC828DRAFT_373958 [Blastocladiella britannica]